MMEISIFGLGYVGCVSAACLADQGNKVIGVDIDEEKVNLINKGQSPVQEAGLEDILKRNVTKGNLSATTNHHDAVLNSDISFVSVGTPSNKDGGLDLGYVYRVIEQIGKALKDKRDFHPIALRSTVLPGTVNQCAKKIEGISKKKLNKGFGMAANPEFLREGSAVEDFYNPPYTIIGATNQKTGDLLTHLYELIDAPILKTDVKVAEMIKYVNNSFHALKVGFTNEIGNICKELGIDSHRVMDIFCRDKKLNLSSYYLKPGFAFGGSCLPKDTRALTQKASTMGLEAKILNNILPSNEDQIFRALNMVKQTGHNNIGLIGITFKKGTDDLRESPMVKLAKKLLDQNYQVMLYDPKLSKTEIFGSNRRYIEQMIPNFESHLCFSLSTIVENSKVLVIGVNSDQIANALDKASPEKQIIDLVRISNPIEKFRAKDNYHGICW